MDPNACLVLIAAALEEGNYVAAAEHAEDLAAWLEKGGFAPDWERLPLATEFYNLSCGE